MVEQGCPEHRSREAAESLDPSRTYSVYLAPLMLIRTLRTHLRAVGLAPAGRNASACPLTTAACPARQVARADMSQPYKGSR